MAGDQRRQAIPTQLELAEFDQFILPHFFPGRRGPAPKHSLWKTLKLRSEACVFGLQWKALPIDEDGDGRLEPQDTRMYRI